MSSPLVALGLADPRCERAHPLPRCPPTDAASHSIVPHGAATSPSESSSGYGPPPLWPCAGTHTPDRAEKWREASGRGSAYCRPRGYPCGHCKCACRPSLDSGNVQSRLVVIRPPGTNVVALTSGALQGPIFPAQRLDVSLTRFGVEKLVEMRRNRHG